MVLFSLEESHRTQQTRRRTNDHFFCSRAPVGGGDDKLVRSPRDPSHHHTATNADFHAEGKHWRRTTTNRPRWSGRSGVTNTAPTCPTRHLNGQPQPAGRTTTARSAHQRGNGSTADPAAQHSRSTTSTSKRWHQRCHVHHSPFFHPQDSTSQMAHVGLPKHSLHERHGTMADAWQRFAREARHGVHRLHRTPRTWRVAHPRSGRPGPSPRAKQTNRLADDQQKPFKTAE